MSAALPRRDFLGLLAVGGTGLALSGCSTGDGSPRRPPLAPPPLIAEVVTDDDLTTWFADPASVAALGAGEVGEQMLGPCGIAASTDVTTREELVAAIARERACGSLVQLGGWFLAPTEAAIAQAVARPRRAA